MCKDKINFCKTIRFTLFLSSLKILKYQDQKQENFIILRRIAIYKRFHKWQFLFAYNCYLQIGFSSHPLVKPIMNTVMFGYEAKRFFISCLTVLSGLIALHRYRRQEITPKARLRWCSVKSESIQLSLWQLMLVGFLENILYHILEWCAMIFRKTEIASNQLESSRAEYKPNSVAILDFNGDWFKRFLYILERVPNVAVSKIIHASGLSPSKVFLSQLGWSIIYWRTKGSEFLSNSYFISNTKFVWNCWLLKREPSRYHNPVFVANESVVMNFVRNPTSRISTAPKKYIT